MTEQLNECVDDASLLSAAVEQQPPSNTAEIWHEVQPQACIRLQTCERLNPCKDPTNESQTPQLGIGNQILPSCRHAELQC